MKLDHSFTIPLPIEQAWITLLDAQLVASAFPGATLDTVDGDSCTGTVRVKLGPIAMTYGGSAEFTSKDEKTHVAELDAAGRDTRGAGTARARVTLALTGEAPDSTTVRIETDLTITGKPAQFGRGVISGVSDKILGQFVQNLEARLASGGTGSAATPSSGGAAATASAAASSTPSAVGAAADDSLDLGRTAVLPLIRRYLPALGAIAAALVGLAAVLHHRHRNIALQGQPHVFTHNMQ